MPYHRQGITAVNSLVIASGAAALLPQLMLDILTTKSNSWDVGVVTLTNCI